MKKLKGILKFETELDWSKDVLDKSFNTVITDIHCTLFFPKLNELWFEDKNNDLDYLHMSLKSPSSADTWYIGNKEKTWGYLKSYPTGISHISDLFCIFHLDENNDINDVSKKLYDGINSWKNTFYKYLKLLSKQLRFKDNKTNESPSLTLYFNSSRIQDNHEFTFECIEYEDCITSDIVIRALTLTKTNFHIPLHYNLILDAYNELENSNYRKAVIDAATSLETLLTQKIITEFTKQNITFGDKLLRDYSMISNKFKLLKILDIPIPSTDYKKKILEPRNKAVHGGNPLDKKTAIMAIKEVEKYLDTFCPLI